MINLRLHQNPFPGNPLILQIAHPSPLNTRQSHRIARQMQKRICRRVLAGSLGDFRSVIVVVPDDTVFAGILIADPEVASDAPDEAFGRTAALEDGA